MENYQANIEAVEAERRFVEETAAATVRNDFEGRRDGERRWAAEAARAARVAWKEAILRAVTKGEGLLVAQRPESSLELEPICKVCYSPGAYVAYLVWPENSRYDNGARYRVSSAARPIVEGVSEEFLNVALSSGEQVVVTVTEAFELGLREVDFECNPPR